MTTYGKLVAEKLIFEVASRGITIVSGFMYGIDATAHKAALDAGGRTIAVMPCGIDTINPFHQKELYQQIIDNNGLVISEYGGDSQPQLWTYPKRNRIVAGICKAVLIVEAALDSGSLITAKFAKDYNRKVLAVPGPITSTKSEGTLMLIANGAVMVRSSEDVLKVFGMYSNLPLFKKEKGNDIFQLISAEPLNMDELVEKTGKSTCKIGSEITMMLLSGQIIEEGGKYYVNQG